MKKILFIICSGFLSCACFAQTNSARTGIGIAPVSADKYSVYTSPAVEIKKQAVPATEIDIALLRQNYPGYHTEIVNSNERQSAKAVNSETENSASPQKVPAVKEVRQAKAENKLIIEKVIINKVTKVE